MQRYFLAESLEDYRSAEIVLEGEQFHHMIRVMRMEEDDGSQRPDESEQELRTALPAGQDTQPRRPVRNAQDARLFRKELAGAGAAGMGIREY